MEPQTGAALLLIAVFVLPGFVTLLFRERTYWVRGDDTPFERLLNALYYSALVYLTLALVALVFGQGTEDVSALYRGEHSFGVYIGLAAVGFLLLPLAIAELSRTWQRSKRLRPWILRKAGIDRGHSVPAGWEQMFLHSPGAREGHLLLRITLEDGRVVGGYFGADSLAGYTAHTRDLFIEERWVLDDDKWFKDPAEQSRGLWVAEDQIRSIEAYAPPSSPESNTTAHGSTGPGDTMSP